LTEQHRKDRQQVEDRSVAQEHRLLEELDRTRQELKRAKLTVSDEKRRLDTTQANFTEKVEALKLRVDQEVAHRTQLELELMAAQATVQATESRAENLQQLAAKQRASLGIKLNKGLAAPRDLKPRIRKLVLGKKWSKTP
jgi:erythromycin esterase-like protein